MICYECGHTMVQKQWAPFAALKREPVTLMHDDGDIQGCGRIDLKVLQCPSCKNIEFTRVEGL